MAISNQSLYKKILVTGSSAVLGSALKLLATQFKKEEFIFLSSGDCDLTDIIATEKLIGNYRPDAIIHLAAISGGIGLSMKHHASMFRDIMLMTISILEAARKNKVKKTIMTLTTGMYPVKAVLPLKEEDMHNGYPHESNYGSSFAKRMIDPAVRAYREEYGMNVIGLIPSGIFGENDNFNYEDAPMLPALIRRFYESKDNNEKIIVWGNGSPLREYTYSADLARIFLWALENYDAPQCINIGTTEENSIKDIAFMIADIMKIDRSRIVFDATKPNGIFRKNISNERFIKLSDFNYTPFHAALEKTIEWFITTYENNPEKLRLCGKSKRS